MKTKAILLSAFIALTLVSGCTSKPSATSTPDQTDTVSSASTVDNAAAFKNAVSANGTWIICLIKDLSIDEELVLDGEFFNGKKDTSGKDIVQRKIALYTQDADHNITARYTLTVPKLTVKSPNASLQHGTFKGDLYIAVDNFQLVDTKVEGSVYFSSEAVQDSFSMDAASSVTGVQEIKQ